MCVMVGSLFSVLFLAVAWFAVVSLGLLRVRARERVGTVGRRRFVGGLMLALFVPFALLSGCAAGTQGAVALHFGRETARAICAAVGAVDAAFPEQPSGQVIVNVPASGESSSAPASSGSP